MSITMWAFAAIALVALSTWVEVKVGVVALFLPLGLVAYDALMISGASPWSSVCVDGWLQQCGYGMAPTQFLLGHAVLKGVFFLNLSVGALVLTWRGRVAYDRRRRERVSV